MINEYLKNCKQQLMEQRIDLVKSLQKNEMLIKENIEFIHFIENSEDKTYESFSPQQYNVKYDNEKLKALKDRNKELEENSAHINAELRCLDEKIQELEEIIRIAKENEKDKMVKIKDLEDNEVFRLKLLETQEYERQRIARELHDSTVQRLTSMIHKIEICSKLMDIDTVRCKLELKNLSQMVKESIYDMREVIYNLRPMSLDDIGIEATLQREIHRIRKNTEMEIAYDSIGDSEGILSVIGLSILRIIQEACSNAIKHSGAKNFSIHIEYGEDAIKMELSDDGCGFDVDEVKNISTKTNSGFGISMMYERVYLLSGTIDFKSQRDKGTKISISIPKKEAI